MAKIKKSKQKDESASQPAQQTTSQHVSFADPDAAKARLNSGTERFVGFTGLGGISENGELDSIPVAESNGWGDVGQGTSGWDDQNEPAVNGWDAAAPMTVNSPAPSAWNDAQSTRGEVNKWGGSQASNHPVATTTHVPDVFTEPKKTSSAKQAAEPILTSAASQAKKKSTKTAQSGTNPYSNWSSNLAWNGASPEDDAKSEMSAWDRAQAGRSRKLDPPSFASVPPPSNPAWMKWGLNDPSHPAKRHVVTATVPTKKAAKSVAYATAGYNSIHGPRQQAYASAGQPRRQFLREPNKHTSRKYKKSKQSAPWSTAPVGWGESDENAYDETDEWMDANNAWGDEEDPWGTNANTRTAYDPWSMTDEQWNNDSKSKKKKKKEKEKEKNTDPWGQKNDGWGDDGKQWDAGDKWDEADWGNDGWNNNNGGWNSNYDGWGNDNEWGDDDKWGESKPTDEKKKKLTGKLGTSYKMPSKTLAYASRGAKTPLVNSWMDYADITFVDSKQEALALVQEAFYSTARPARERFHWLFSPEKDEAVSALLKWLEEMSYALGAYGLHNFLQSRERGALFVNAAYRRQDKPDEPAFDWLTFDELQPTLDKTLQSSVAYYDPAKISIVFVFLPSPSGKSVAIWRRKVLVPNNVRLAYQDKIKQAKATLRKDYTLHVDRQQMMEAKLAPTLSPKKKPKKKRKWWHIFW